MYSARRRTYRSRYYTNNRYQPVYPSRRVASRNSSASRRYYPKNSSISAISRQDAVLDKRRFGLDNQLKSTSNPYRLPRPVVGEVIGYHDFAWNYAAMKALPQNTTDLLGLGTLTPKAYVLHCNANIGLGTLPTERLGPMIQNHSMEFCIVPIDNGTDVVQGGQFYQIDVFFDKRPTGSAPVGTDFFESIFNDGTYNWLDPHTSVLNLENSGRFVHIGSLLTEKHGVADTYHKQHGAKKALVDFQKMVTEYKESDATGGLAYIVTGAIYIVIRTSRGTAWTTDDLIVSGRLFYSHF